MASISEVAGDDKRSRASRKRAGFDQRRRTSESACDNRSAGLNAQGAKVEQMGVDHGVDDVVVAHQLISRADVLAGLQQMTDAT